MLTGPREWKWSMRALLSFARIMSLPSGLEVRWCEEEFVSSLAVIAMNRLGLMEGKCLIRLNKKPDDCLVLMIKTPDQELSRTAHDKCSIIFSISLVYLLVVSMCHRAIKLSCKLCYLFCTIQKWTTPLFVYFLCCGIWSLWYSLLFLSL